jgi:hypothetical protein
LVPGNSTEVFLENEALFTCSQILIGPAQLLTPDF